MTTATRPPGRPRSENADRAILAAAVDELTERGFNAMTMEGIAARAGVAKSTIYRRYADIGDLGVAAIRTLLVDESYPQGPARTVLAELLDRMRRTWNDPQYAALMRRVSADGTDAPDLYRSCRERIIGPTVRALNRAIRQAVEEGIVRPDVDVEWMRTLLVAPIMAGALTHKARLSAAQVEFNLDTVLAGLRPTT